MANKKILRQVYLEKRLTLTAPEYQLRNQLLQNQILQSIPFESINLVHLFMSMEKQKEVMTAPILDVLKTKYNHLHFAISKTRPKRQLEHYLFDETTQIEISSWGIPEPLTGTKVEESEIDFIFVPLIICDKKGYRIGYGGGYYDIFLSKTPQARKIGLSLSPLLDSIPYVEDFDVPLDGCVTPFETVIF